MCLSQVFLTPVIEYHALLPLLLTGCYVCLCARACVCVACLFPSATAGRSYVAVSKVLDTRRGRCGEYSVLMMRLLEALGYTCRWVVDWSDHVWVEARVGGSWVHIDPCEVGAHAVSETFVHTSISMLVFLICSFS